MEHFGQGETARGRGVEHLGQGRNGVGLSMGCVVYGRDGRVPIRIVLEHTAGRTRSSGRNLDVIPSDS